MNIKNATMLSINISTIIVLLFFSFHTFNNIKQKAVIVDGKGPARILPTRLFEPFVCEYISRKGGYDRYCGPIQYLKNQIFVEAKLFVALITLIPLNILLLLLINIDVRFKT